VVTDVHLPVVEQHAIDSLDGIVCSFSSLVVNETVTLGPAVFISGNLAGQNITEGGKGIVKRLQKTNMNIPLPYLRHSVVTNLVVDAFVKILDKNVALTSLTESRITLRPHDAAT